MNKNIKKIDLKDLSFLIPLRLDSIDRLENIVLIVDYIVQHFDTNIQILEASKFDNGILKKLLPTKTVQIEFVEDHDPIFHRTHYINVLTQKVITPYCAVWDADVIVDSTQLNDSVQILREGLADFVYPYQMYFLDVPEIIKEHYHETRDINILKDNAGKMKKFYYPDPIGGAFLVNREKYIESGLENVKYYGWGIEDGERLNRWLKLGYKVQRVQGPLFHFSHSRGINSKYLDVKQREIKQNDFFQLGMMSKKELELEVSKWKKNNM